MKLIKPPNKLEFDGTLNVFLAGSIEMGSAENWQDKLINQFNNPDIEINFFNPRRDNWDSSWVQSIDNTVFYEQVNWELEALENADVAVFYFDPNTKSPITLMELGFAIGRETNNLCVCCPEGFWRKGNIDIICDKNRIKQVDDLYQLSEYIFEQYSNNYYSYMDIIHYARNKSC